MVILRCWKKIVTFTSRWEGGMKWIIRVLIGLFFLLSGGYKLFEPSHREALYDTLVQAKIPLPSFNVYFVAIIEFLFGLFLMAGFCSALSCLLLTLNLLVALFTVQWKTLPSSSVLLFLANLLYLPEVLLIMLLSWLFFAGPGKGSVDYLICKLCQKD